MMKFSDCLVNATLDQVEYQKQFKFTIPKLRLPDWCLVLVMLRDRLIDEAVVSSEGDAKKLSFQCSARVALHELPNHHWAVQLRDNDIDCLCRFYLEYYRDGAAAVNHIDVEAISADSEAYLTFEAAAQQPPMNDSEARRLLGL